MSSIVISQPMYLPWLGIFEQIKTADIFVHYVDVQMPNGRSFSSRVQLKTDRGQEWITVPIRRNLGQLIRDVEVDNSQNWRGRHLRMLRHSLGVAPFGADAIGLAEKIIGIDALSLSTLCIYGIEEIAQYLGLKPRFAYSDS